MAKIRHETLPPPPKEYSQRQQATLVRALQLALRGVDYVEPHEVTANKVQSWMGL